MDTSILSEKAQARLNEIKQQVRAKMKANVPKRTFSLETRQKMSLAAKNRSPDAKQKTIGLMSQMFTCIHCGKVGKGVVMYKYHFDNCKQKA